MRLADKVALITGGGSGIGRASAVRFAREGAKIAVSDMNRASADETARAVEAEGGEAAVVIGDVSNSSDAERMVQAAVEAFGKLNVLVNSAGVSGRNALPPEASSEDVWDKVLDVNLKGTYLVSWFAVPEMEKTGGGSIINLASIMGLVGYPAGFDGGFNPYNPSKGGVVQFTRNLAVASAPKNVRVNCICPGFVDTNLTSMLKADDEVYRFLEERHPMGRFGKPEEIANVALYLASDESSFVTGTPLAVDGGYTAQ
ncbi:MAG: glucose 1-dehydrogenase [SAR202 cluster bacterium]|jgi:NAD(P)-dependent dehydrogenase (short-subunit alcohol dehydrogenase family)|nr:short-chain dehydrogenase [Chloroflexota bacterium]MDP6421004.1 glucose 1-dehydrogenase [SAR202 cluster bacterium]HAL49114.1 short-chain dehydrogenase [Dehalococcoidia bacterium]MDP6664547.1 glucose 1-dehydrogenase [SAR202 cluster bacterium]MDP6800170.1 glucose 1-dehydrogenase [SAR202 cluster bacterium]|tara:strand:- start:5066 stop:5836 length:771 start_codon:yes stop_codon:yes gene_type:complete